MYSYLCVWYDYHNRHQAARLCNGIAVSLCGLVWCIMQTSCQLYFTAQITAYSYVNTVTTMWLNCKNLDLVSVLGSGVTSLGNWWRTLPDKHVASKLRALITQWGGATSPRGLGCNTKYRHSAKADLRFGYQIYNTKFRADLTKSNFLLLLVQLSTYYYYYYYYHHHHHHHITFMWAGKA